MEQLGRKHQHIFKGISPPVILSFGWTI